MGTSGRVAAVPVTTAGGCDENRTADRYLIRGVEAATRVDVEDGDAVRQVAGDEHPAVIREREEPGPPAPAGDPLPRRDQPVRADRGSRQ
jgi:hypothetical protein